MGHRRLFLLFLMVFLATTHNAGHGQAATITQQQQAMGGVGSMMRSMVGSRPPSCAGRCWWCSGRRCEAVQVPVTPQELRRMKKGSHGGSAISAAAQGRPSSYDDSSNYKPLSWRCMCGEAILNP